MGDQESLVFLNIENKVAVHSILCSIINKDEIMNFQIGGDGSVIIACQVHRNYAEVKVKMMNKWPNRSML